jgi:DNA polymerase-3 subunit gamma/tau
MRLTTRPKLSAVAMTVPPQGAVAEPLKKQMEQKHQPTVQEQAVAVNAEVSGDVKRVWDEMLKELVTKGKRSVHACVSQGNLVSLDEKQAIVQFAAAFPKERTEKEDYREIVEKVLTQLCGKTVHLCCILGTVAATPKAKTTASSKPKAVSSALPPEGTEHPVVRQALDMFGGKVTKKE